jgi:hypothetical protein
MVLVERRSRSAAPFVTATRSGPTSVRLISGALMLALLVHGWQRFRASVIASRGRFPGLGGSWISALALFAYASSLSFSYANISTGIGALLLAMAGVVAILSPRLDTPPLGSALLMLASGVAWGVYSLRGRGVADPTGDTAGNFLRAAFLSVLLSAALLTHQQLDGLGALYAVLSGAITSGMGYAVWYVVLPKLMRTCAAAVQLSVPVLASLAGALFVHESITLSLLLTSVAVLGGIAMVVYSRPSAVWLFGQARRLRLKRRQEALLYVLHLLTHLLDQHFHVHRNMG